MFFERQGRALTNFDRTLPPPQSNLAQELLKDPSDPTTRNMLHYVCIRSFFVLARRFVRVCRCCCSLFFEVRA